MNRKISFRGYNLKNKQWIYGYYLVNRGKHYIVQDGVAEPFKEASDFEVDAESVGQYVTNVDGVDLYEGDYVDRIELRYFEGECYPVFRLKCKLMYHPETHLVMLACIDNENNAGYIRTDKFKYEVKGNEYEQKLKKQYEDTETRS